MSWFHRSDLKSKTMASRVVLAFTLFFSVLLLPEIVHADDLENFRNMMSLLCEYNTNSSFGICCNKYNPRELTLEKTEARNCFLNDVNFSSDNLVIGLFVVWT